MSARREELTRIAARLFADRGYHGTSLADLAEALGIQKASLYHHIDSKEDLLWEVARAGAESFHTALDAVPEGLPATEKIRLALRAHLRVVGEQLDVATVFTREWRALQGERRERFVAERRRYEERIRDLFREGVERGELRTDLDVATVFTREWRALQGERRERFVAERRRYEERIRDLFREGVEGGELRTDLDVATAALLFLSAANWAYTWLRAGADTEALADRFFGVLLDGMRGYATPG
jgi:TetR/AcrR family transcriptional regulator, cholesterol catabolism regulator